MPVTFLAAALLLAPATSAAPQDAKPPAPAMQISQYVRVIFEDRAGNIWFGTNDDGVCRHDGKSFVYFTTKDGFGGKAVRGISQDGDGNLWFATDGGVSRYDGKAFTTFKVKDGLPDDEAWSVLVDSKGTLWVGTVAGVCRYDGTAFARFPIPAANAEGTPRYNRKLVWAIFADRAGNLWFGTDGDGVRRYDGESFKTYTVKDGLAADNVRCILQDRGGNIWFGTWGGGVIRFDGEGAFTTFTERQGLASNDIWTMLEEKGGGLWLGTLGGGSEPVRREVVRHVHREGGPDQELRAEHLPGQGREPLVWLLRRGVPLRWQGLREFPRKCHQVRMCRAK